MDAVAPSFRRRCAGQLRTPDPRKAGRSSAATTCLSRVKGGRAPPTRARYVSEAAPAPGVQTGDGWPWVRRYSLPAADTETTTPRSGARWRTMKPRSFASSQTGSRGHEVRHASSTSAYARGLGPIHSRRSRIRLSMVSVTEIYEHRSGERVLWLVGRVSSPIGRHSGPRLRRGEGEVFVSELGGAGHHREARLPHIGDRHAARTTPGAQARPSAGR
jgi:hypothetical protein